MQHSLMVEVEVENVKRLKPFEQRLRYSEPQYCMFVLFIVLIILFWMLTCLCNTYYFLSQFHIMIQNAGDEAASALEKLNHAECNVKSLRNMMKRMILTQEEMVHIPYDFPKQLTLLRTHLIRSFHTLGRDCSQEVLACPILGLMCPSW